MPEDVQKRLELVMEALKKQFGSFMFYFSPKQGVVWSHIETLTFGNALNMLMTAIHHLVELELKGHKELKDDFKKEYNDILLGFIVKVDQAFEEAQKENVKMRAALKAK